MWELRAVLDWRRAGRGEKRGSIEMGEMKRGWSGFVVAF